MDQSTRRIDTTHIDEVSRTCRSSVQWQLEKLNKAESLSHPISHNSKLEVFICGEKSFEEIAKDIANAEGSIDLCCWGFDPGMELVRIGGPTWPRGVTFGDALISAAARGVRTRLLVWHDLIGGILAKNMPGYTHGLQPWCRYRGKRDAARICAADSLARLAAELRKPLLLQTKYQGDRIYASQMHQLARDEYCYSWYMAAFRGDLPGITITKRNGKVDAIKSSLDSEKRKPGSLSNAEVEAFGMERLGTHHQKTILIDYERDGGSRALGYVMGLNSVTDYWDTSSHLLEDGKREQGGVIEADECLQGMEQTRGFRTLKPYQDYACRIEGGRALISVHANFSAAWEIERQDPTQKGNLDYQMLRQLAHANPPAALLRKAEPGGSSVQIVRTQPEENDRTVKDAYFLAVKNAALASGYLYVENQYFQYEEWTQHLLRERRQVIAKWKDGCAKAKKRLEDMPIMHVFIVMPVPEREGMIPRTYDALATLGQQGAMTGQEKLIKDANEQKPHRVYSQIGVTAMIPAALPEVVKHANTISKPDQAYLESEFGMKVCSAMLNTCGLKDGKWRYREIYIHSKLMMIDDTFFTLGSANINQRSMAVDSELNITVVDPVITRDLRRRVWSQLSGKLVGVGDAMRAGISDEFNKWVKITNANRTAQMEEFGMTGFLVPLADNRSATMRLG